MIQINYRDPRPIYEQVKASFRQIILSGAMLPEEKMPSVRELASSLAINPNTIQRAYRELEQEGYIVSVPGKGSFVGRDGTARRQRRQELAGKLQELVRELKTLGATEEELISLVKEEE